MRDGRRLVLSVSILVEPSPTVVSLLPTLHESEFCVRNRE